MYGWWRGMVCKGSNEILVKNKGFFKSLIYKLNSDIITALVLSNFLCDYNFVHAIGITLLKMQYFCES